MKLVHDRVYVGSEVDCRQAEEGWAVIHACKSPCHQTAVGYKGSLQSSHANYLILEKERDLYMNLIDPPVPLFKPESFDRYLRFATRHWQSGASLVIHCNKGESRPPSLALLFLTKHVRLIKSDSFDDAKEHFTKIYPEYLPGIGIQTFLRENWAKF